jgi:hypothetical protein
MTVIANISTFIGGTVLLSLAFGWQVGIGVALLVHFHKTTEK